MKLRDPKLRDLLAAEYVLGTLGGRARARFSALLAQDPDLERRVSAWEAHLGTLLATVPPETPPARVWRTIAAELRVPDRPDQRFWRPLAIAASVLALVLGGGLWHEQRHVPVPVEMALLGNPAKPAWVLTLQGTKTLEIRAEQPPHLAPGHSYQLWMLPGRGRPPHSLGLLPEVPGRSVHLRGSLTLARASGIAVSLEPVGGSPLPGPSGPVVFSATWIKVAPTG
ncbi:MAG TPA: anti-sigma factor [Acidiferrobacteraceae bacterium]|nr:anti-sigma factor [Acidiferrobacteraceae bacterium]